MRIRGLRVAGARRDPALPLRRRAPALESKAQFLLVVATAAAGVSLLVLVLCTLRVRGTGHSQLSEKQRTARGTAEKL